MIATEYKIKTNENIAYMALAENYGVRLSQTSPQFLHANSTSHIWPFSAIAELIDNAYDPDVHASQLYIDKKNIQNFDSLVFTDNGAGMDHDKLHHMLSFGYCDKVEVNGLKPVGHYGNGFKSGSMRLGLDTVVFTKQRSVGFLSQSYLKSIKAETVLVPIVSFSIRNDQMQDTDDAIGSIKAITRYSPFKSVVALKEEMKALDNFTSGTRIIIYNLKKTMSNKLELDFESDSKDIISSDTHELDTNSAHRLAKDHQPEFRRSLREYCAILFLKPRMKIILRGEKVKTKLISRSLSQTEGDVYQPKWLKKPVKIIFGFGGSEEDYGMMLYHRNRLIKAYERVGFQKQNNELGVGVVGVVEVDFLEPIHNKQDFNKSDRYNACMSSLSMKLNDYCNEKQTDIASITSERLPDWTWVQCDNCLRWRRLPDGMTDKNLPKKWFCYMNPDASHNRCDIEEEPEEQDELALKATYQKKFKSERQRQKAIQRIEEKRQVVRTREELLQREEELQHMRRKIADLTPLSDTIDLTHPEDRKPSLLDLEKARHELDASRRREKDQLDLIKQLQHQKLQYRKEQNILKDAFTSAKRKQGLVVQIPMHRRLNNHRKRKTGADVIVLDSESDEDEEVCSKRHRIDETDKADVHKSDLPDVEDVSQFTSITRGCAQPADDASVPASVPATLPATLPVSVKQEVRLPDMQDCYTDLKETSDKLRRLRHNVKCLFAIILPEVEIDKVDFVDDIVEELINANGGQVSAPNKSNSSSPDHLIDQSHTAPNIPLITNEKFEQSETDKIVNSEAANTSFESESAVNTSHSGFDAFERGPLAHSSSHNSSGVDAMDLETASRDILVGNERPENFQMPTMSNCEQVCSSTFHLDKDLVESKLE